MFADACLCLKNAVHAYGRIGFLSTPSHCSVNSTIVNCRCRCIFIWRLPSEMTERIHDRLSSIKSSAGTDYSSAALRLQFFSLVVQYII